MQKARTIMRNEELYQETVRITVLSEQKPQGFAGPASWSQGTSGTEMVIWQDDDGWYGCLQGQYKGSWSESEDEGPFETREEAEQAMREYYAEGQEEVSSTGREE
jgi:hypothetical protein